MDYAKITSAFWTGKTGRLIRGDKDTLIVALYLMTSPHANALGVFHCPIIYIAHETGSTSEGASKGLRRLVEIGFCSYDDGYELVWVHEMARHQIGDDLKASDNRVKHVHKLYAEIPESQIKQGFAARYREAFGLPDAPPCPVDNKPLGSPFEAPSKPIAIAIAETIAIAVEESGASPSAQPPPERKRASDAKLGTRLPDDWELPDAWAEWALGEQTTWTPAHLRKVADSFRDYWASKPGAGARKTDWLATWRNWVRREGPIFAGQERSRRVETKFDPTAYVNRSRISTQRRQDEPIDIADDLLDRNASGAGRDCADRSPVQPARRPLSAPMAIGFCQP